MVLVFNTGCLLLKAKVNVFNCMSTQSFAVVGVTLWMFLTIFGLSYSSLSFVIYLTIYLGGSLQTYEKAIQVPLLLFPLEGILAYLFYVAIRLSPDSIDDGRDPALKQVAMAFTSGRLNATIRRAQACPNYLVCSAL